MRAPPQTVGVTPPASLLQFEKPLALNGAPDAKSCGGKGESEQASFRWCFGNSRRDATCANVSEQRKRWRVHAVCIKSACKSLRT